ncbi:hypothetical protein GWK91_15910 [Virgibacillus sp. MSP4-1]|uniref:hypothetical protein n=1 Tax=Virgibacillus sp. MSP4-1 TaxID=2700081 RepID=UPI0005C55555|nr:hypothetical protein [Virgibacillus sp. MSP4-1]QHS24285.1 hypothetical protein GWK91_15910 [Virgibacillus sp. MSP4-1]
MKNNYKKLQKSFDNYIGTTDLKKNEDLNKFYEWLNNHEFKNRSGSWMPKFLTTLLLLSLFMTIFIVFNSHINQKSNLDSFYSDVETEVMNLKDSIDFKMSKKDLKQLLGEEYTNLKDPETGLPAWRYDLFTKEGYDFDSDGFAIVDDTGLKSGDIGIQLFLTFSKEGSLERYDIHYTKKNGNKSYYGKYKNGEVIEN